jgi:hypothetical protein
LLGGMARARVPGAAGEHLRHGTVVLADAAGLIPVHVPDVR